MFFEDQDQDEKKEQWSLNRCQKSHPGSDKPWKVRASGSFTTSSEIVDEIHKPVPSHNAIKDLFKTWEPYISIQNHLMFQQPDFNITIAHGKPNSCRSNWYAGELLMNNQWCMRIQDSCRTILTLVKDSVASSNHSSPIVSPVQKYWNEFWIIHSQRHSLYPSHARLGTVQPSALKYIIKQTVQL